MSSASIPVCNSWTTKNSELYYLAAAAAACEMSAIVWYLEHSLALPFFGIGMKTDLFQSCGFCWVSQICWHIECSTFTASSFRIWSRSTGIPSPPLALFVVMLPKAHLTSHSRMSGSRWVITSLLLSELWRSFFVQFFCVLLPPLLNIFCFCQVYTISVLYWAFLCMKCSFGISSFLVEISSLSHSIIFFYFFVLLIYADLLSLLSILWNSTFS